MSIIFHNSIHNIHTFHYFCSLFCIFIFFLNFPSYLSCFISSLRVSQYNGFGDSCYWLMSSNFFFKNHFQWIVFSKQFCVRFWHLHNDIHQIFTFFFTLFLALFPLFLRGDFLLGGVAQVGLQVRRLVFWGNGWA
jgi:hypothetical protein